MNIKKIYDIGKTQEGTFIDRPNRFVANIKISSGIVQCHLHDSGRLGELLYPGNKINIRKASGDTSNRKTKYDIISAVSDDDENILINSSLHRYISETFLNDPHISPFGRVTEVCPEVKHGDSRLDYLIKDGSNNIWVEVKGVSLSLDKTAMFPDAPSKRAVKHLKELMDIKRSGDRAAVLLLILRDSDRFRPRYETDPDFCTAFYEAISVGVEVYPIQFFLKNDTIYYKNKKIKIMSKEAIK